GVWRDDVVGVLRVGDGAHAGAAEGWSVEVDEDLTGACSLGLIQPRLQLLHLRFVLGPISIPRRWRAIVVFAGPQEDEASAVEIELIDEPLVGNPELLQVWESLQQALDVGVVPHFVVAYRGENTTRQAGSAHLLVRGRQLFQYVLIHQFPIRVLRRRGALLAPPNHVAGIKDKLGSSALDIFHNFAGDPLAALQ